MHRKRFWVIEYWVYEPERDDRNKLDHLHEMWHTILQVEQPPFRTVLTDSFLRAIK